MSQRNHTLMFNARVYRAGSAVSTPAMIGVENGDIVLKSEEGQNLGTLDGENWDLKLGGSNESRVVLEKVETRESIVADIQLLNVLAAGSNYGDLTKSAKKFKRGAFGRMISQSSGTIAVVGGLVFFGLFLCIGFSHFDSKMDLHSSKDSAVPRAENSAETGPAFDSSSLNSLLQGKNGSVGVAYAKTAMKKIESHIKPSSRHLAGNFNTAVDVLVSRDGSILTATLQEGSGNPQFDEDTRQAVLKASPLAPLPKVLEAPGDFIFHYHVRNKAKEFKRAN